MLVGGVTAARDGDGDCQTREQNQRKFGAVMPVKL